jgi:dTMP kinase
MAVLFALDRAGAADRISDLLSANDIVLLDRYVASNAAYNAARAHQGVDGEMVAWVRELELGRLALPAPDLQLYLDVPVALAEQRARSREAEDNVHGVGLRGQHHDGNAGIRTQDPTYVDAVHAGQHQIEQD